MITSRLIKELDTNNLSLVQRYVLAYTSTQRGARLDHKTIGEPKEEDRGKRQDRKKKKRYNVKQEERRMRIRGPTQIARSLETRGTGGKEHQENERTS
jgi:hypothetical protein